MKENGHPFLWKQYRHLAAFRKRYRRRTWPAHNEEFPPGNPLGRFCAQLNAYFRKNHLPVHLVCKLLSLRFPLSLGVSHWEADEHERLRSLYPYLELFLRQFENLKKFRKSNPDRWPGDSEQFPPGNPIGNWVTRLRRDKKKKKLPPYQVRLLDTLEFFWEGEREWRWQISHARLMALVSRYPDSWRPKVNVQLASWLVMQRRKIAADSLSPWKKKKLLRDFGPIFHPLGRWGLGFEALVAFRKRFPDRWPKVEEKFPDGFPLGKWCVKQRNRKRTGELKRKYIQLLSGIEFAFVPRVKEEQWMRQYEYLSGFRRKHPGRWPLYEEEFPRGNALGIWCSLQRSMHAQETLKAERARLLNRIGFGLDRLHQDWESRYQELSNWLKKNPGRLPRLNPLNQEEYRQKTWITKQRSTRFARALSASQKHRLAKLGVLE